MPPAFERVWEDASLIKGYLRREDARVIYDAACAVPHDQMIVETGCYRGRSTTVLAESGRNVWTVDPMEIGGADGITLDDVDALRRNLLPFPRVVWKRQTARTVAAPEETVGLLFIDGNHTGDWPRLDFECFEKSLAPAAKVIFHDRQSGPVKDAVRGLAAQGKIRILRHVRSSVVCVRSRASYSQGGEDTAAREFLGDGAGRFLDVGAWDGVDKSNTRLLAEHGWGGVLVEPAVKPFDRLVSNYTGFDGIELVHAAIMPRRGLLRFWDTADALSSFDARHVGVWRDKAGVPFREIWTPTITFADLFAALPGTYDFVSIDAEGHSVDLLQAFDPLRTGTRLVCVEDDARLGDIAKWGERHGFRRVARTNENVLLGRPAA